MLLVGIAAGGVFFESPLRIYDMTLRSHYLSIRHQKREGITENASPQYRMDPFNVELTIFVLCCQVQHADSIGQWKREFPGLQIALNC